MQSLIPEYNKINSPQVQKYSYLSLTLTTSGFLLAAPLIFQKINSPADNRKWRRPVRILTSYLGGVCLSKTSGRSFRKSLVVSLALTCAGSMLSHLYLRKKSLPPPKLSQCTAIVCNGEIEVSQSQKKRIDKCRSLIGVDGGLNHCQKMGLTPDLMVGDFDSVEKIILEQFKSVGSTSLPRAKDCTDLEAAIALARKTSSAANLIIWGGLGGRIDHTLSNLFVLLRQPGRTFIESEKQKIFGISKKQGRVKISEDKASTLALIPFYGPAERVELTINGQIKLYPTVDKRNLVIVPFEKSGYLKIGKGELLVILDHRKVRPVNKTLTSLARVNFSLDQSLIQIFDYLFHQSINSSQVKLVSEKLNTEIVNVQKTSRTLSFSAQVGETISLIPFYGAARGLQTQGLKWELNSQTVDELNREFVGISNVSMQGDFTLSISEGEVLCISNKEVIDQEMVKAKI